MWTHRFARDPNLCVWEPTLWWHHTENSVWSKSNRQAWNETLKNFPTEVLCFRWCRRLSNVQFRLCAKMKGTPRLECHTRIFKSKNPWSQSTKNMAQTLKITKNKNKNRHRFVDQKHKHNENYWFCHFSPRQFGLSSVSERVIVTAFVSLWRPSNTWNSRGSVLCTKKHGHFSVANNQLSRKREIMVRNSNKIDANEPFLGTWGLQNQMERGNFCDYNWDA